MFCYWKAIHINGINVFPLSWWWYMDDVLTFRFMDYIMHPYIIITKLFFHFHYFHIRCASNNIKFDGIMFSYSWLVNFQISRNVQRTLLFICAFHFHLSRKQHSVLFLFWFCRCHQIGKFLLMEKCNVWCTS